MAAPSSSYPVAPMQSREFRSSDGRRWRVWPVIPGLPFGERRVSGERRATSCETLADPPLLERRRTADRRAPDRRTTDRDVADRRAVGEPGRRQHLLPEPWRTGWLVFECVRDDGPDAREARRLAPIPPDWTGCPEPRLLALWADAQRVGRAGR